MIRSALLAVTALATGALALDYSPTRYQQLDYFGGFGENTPMFINPGNITDADQTEIMLALYSTINSQAGLQYISGVYPFGLNHTIGATAFINGASIDGEPGVDANNKQLSRYYRKDAVFLGYGYRVFHWMTLGANVSLLNFNNFGEKDLPVGADFGVLFNPIQNSKFGFLKIGAAVQNALQVGPYNNTTNLNFGVHWLGLNRRIEGRTEFSVIDLGMYKKPEEGTSKMLFPWAVGVQYYLSQNLALGLKQTREGFPMLTFAGNAKRLSFFRYLQVELDLTHDGISFNDEKRGLLWNVKGVARIGPTREEVLGAKRYARLIREPEMAFQEAMKLYLQRRFVDAAYAFGKVVVKYPTYRKVDIATYYQGRSFENLRMHDVAKKVYENGIKTYDASDYVPKYYFQLLNIAYKEEKWNEALQHYNLIAGKYGETDIKPDADYVMGQAYFAQARFSEARQLLQGIKPEDANYGYARYTLGLIATREAASREGTDEKKLAEAQEHFESILARQPRNKSERELQEASSVKLGHVLYSFTSTPQLTRAVELYKQVPASSIYYDEAQLATAWCFVRNLRWDDALKHIDNLVKNSPTSILVPEAYLVKGYALWQKKQLGKALESMEAVLTMLGKGFLSKDEIDKRNGEFTSSMSNFNNVQENIYQLSLQLPTERVNNKRDEIRPEVDRIRQAIEDNFKFQELVAKQRKFEKDHDRVKNDAEYAKAKILLEINSGAGPGTSTGGDEFDSQ